MTYGDQIAQVNADIARLTSEIDALEKQASREQSQYGHYGNDMYTGAGYHAALVQAEQATNERAKQYNERSVDVARESYQAALARLNEAKQSAATMREVPRLTQELQAAQQALDDALKYAGPLAARAKTEKLHKQAEQARAARQREEAESNESQARAQFAQTWAEIGGLPELRESAWKSYRQEQLMDQVRQGGNVAALKARYRASGRYDF